MIQRVGKEAVTLLFADTMMEDEDLYRFNVEASAFLGVPITRIADGRTPWQVFFAEGMMGNSRVDLCSRILKRELLDRWHRENCLELACTSYIGIDWTESHRLDRLRLRRPGWKIEAPMTEPELWDKQRMFCELTKIGIEPPRLYKMGFPHNNCGGFCIKAGQAHFAHLLRVMPERYAYHEAQEQKFVTEKAWGQGILKDRTGGKTTPLTLKQLRERIEAGKEFDRHEWGGCGCSIEAINLQIPEAVTAQ